MAAFITGRNECRSNWNRRHARAMFLAGTVLCSSMLSLATEAQTLRSYVGPADGNVSWNNPAIWSPAGVPGAFDSAWITGTGDPSIDVNYVQPTPLANPLNRVFLDHTGGGGEAVLIPNQDTLASYEEVVGCVGYAGQQQF